jgi:hypothetical protein
MKILRFLHPEPSEKSGGFNLPKYFLFIDFFLPWVKRKEIIKNQKLIIAVKKIGGY